MGEWSGQLGRVLTGNDSVLCAGEGSDREMGFISSEPALQEFMPHSLDTADNTPPPSGDTRPHATRDTWHCCRVRRARAHGQHGDGHVAAGHDVDARAVPLDEGEEVLTETNAR